ncbi:uncharacterized protein [Diabrotica undecimpunctata]|uniref:uncharacterized protein n=1 Tax=Diabrotica undecimpunctata TaxID=50387 RepID=UPI003B634638
MLERELMRKKVDICGVLETHWEGQGHWESNYYKIFMSGANKTGQKGVAILVQKNLAKCVYEYLPINDRPIKITLDGQPTKIHVLQVYMPTRDGTDEDVEEMYQLLNSNIANIPKKELVIILGNWNVKVGKTTTEDLVKGTVGGFGIDAINITNPKETPRKEKHWMTNETLNLVEERKIIRNNASNPTEIENKIANVNRRIKSSSRRDKNNHFKEICKQLQEHAKRQESREPFAKVQHLTKEFKLHTKIIKDNLRTIITNIEDHEDVNSEEINDEKEPPILKSEIETAIEKLQTGKSQGDDGITAKALKEMGDIGIEVIFKLCSEIWNTGQWPDDWCKLTFIPIYKKGSLTDCNKYRTIALISQALSTILNLRQIIEKS